MVNLLRFAILGLNSAAYHVLSMALFAIAAAGLGLFAKRATGSALAGVLAAAMLAIHPGMPYSAVAWVTNQMHLMQMLTGIAALAWWFRIRHRGIRWWLPLIGLQVVALLIKEDGIMLVPAIVVLHTMRKWLVEPELPHVPVTFIALGLLAIGTLLAVRHWALAGLEHTRVPGLEQARYNLWRGLSSAFALQPARRPYQPAASWFVVLVPLAAAVLWRSIPRGARFLMMAGIIIGVLYDLPFVFIVKAEQLHMVSLGASLLLAGAAAGLLEASASWRIARLLLAMIVSAGLVAMALVARHITRDFEPFAPGVLATDVHVQGWAAVPLELRELVARKRGADTQGFIVNPSHGLEAVAFGLHALETDPAGRAIRWMSQTTTDIYIRPTIRVVTVPLRLERGAFGEAARVRVTVNGRFVQEMTLDDDRWHAVYVNLRPRNVPLIGRMHRVQIAIPRTWVPAKVLPGSTDTRTLGLQVGAFELR